MITEANIEKNKGMIGGVFYLVTNNFLWVYLTVLKDNVASTMGGVLLCARSNQSINFVNCNFSRNQVPSNENILDLGIFNDLSMINVSINHESVNTGVYIH